MARPIGNQARAASRRPRHDPGRFAGSTPRTGQGGSARKRRAARVGGPEFTVVAVDLLPGPLCGSRRRRPSDRRLIACSVPRRSAAVPEPVHRRPRGGRGRCAPPRPQRRGRWRAACGRRIPGRPSRRQHRAPLPRGSSAEPGRRLPGAAPRPARYSGPCLRGSAYSSISHRPIRPEVAAPYQPGAIPAGLERQPLGAVVRGRTDRRLRPVHGGIPQPVGAPLVDPLPAGSSPRQDPPVRVPARTGRAGGTGRARTGTGSPSACPARRRVSRAASGLARRRRSRGG